MDSASCLEVLNVVDHAWKSWKQAPLSFRQECFTRLSTLLEARIQDLARLMAQEMGKPIHQGIAEIEKCAWVCQYYCTHAKDFLKDRPIETEAESSFVTFQPLGVIFAIMPWNFPFWQVFRAAVPALMAGNAMLLKHAPNVPGCALAIEMLFTQAGFPKNIFRSVLAENDTAEPIIQNTSIQGVTLTGSTRAGSRVGALAGKHLKKVVMELGGSDPYIVLEDANIEQAANICAASRMINGGQSCIAAKRLIVVESIQEAFKETLIKTMAGYTMGDPEDPETTLGPMARIDLRNTLHDQVLKSIEQGATLLLGGALPQEEGYFYPPTVLSEVRPGMPAYEEELFGPVAAIISAKDEKEAIAIANDTALGLGGAVFTRDKHRGQSMATQIQAGNVAINSLVQSDPRLPFGGTKASGFGRELSIYGIHEFVNIKTIVVHES